MTMNLRNVPFSPPDMTEREAEEVKNAIMSGWITTGPRTIRIPTYCQGRVSQFCYGLNGDGASSA